MLDKSPLVNFFFFFFFFFFKADFFSLFIYFSKIHNCNLN